MYQFLPLDNREIFQSFICDLFDHIYQGESFQTFGRNGHKQKGIDVFSSQHSVVIQCKKKDTINRKEKDLINELKNEIEAEPLKVIAEKLQIEFSQFIVASTYKDNPELQEHCSIIQKKHNFNFDLKYYGWDTISRKLENHPDLMSKYYGKFDLIGYYSKVENEIRSSLDIKRKLENNLGKIKYRRVIIKRSTQTDYPEANETPKGQISSWFRVNLWDYYHNGIELIVSPNFRIIKDEEGNWDMLELGDQRQEAYSISKSILLIGQIPYSNIVDIDFEGDGIYNEPHLYCHFRNNGEPYENFEYLEKFEDESLEEPSYWPLDKSKRKKLK